MHGTVLLRAVHVARARRLGGALALGAAAAASLPGSARADAATDAATAKELTTTAERRSGMVFGFGVGVGAAAAWGYPNLGSKIGNPAYYDSSDPMGGVGGTLFIQGALKDWLSFGAFYARANFRSGQWNSYGGGGGIRVDLFPLYSVYPPLRDLGVYGQFGIGTATLSPNAPGGVVSNGTQSFLGGGAFYEFFLGKGLGGHFAAGPTVEFDAEVTTPNQRDALLFGARVAFYTGR